MILVVGSVVASEQGLAHALALCIEHVNRSRQEQGCIAHSVHQDAENARRLVFVEKWATRVDLWEHFKVPASQNFVKALATLCSEAPSLDIYDAVSVPLPGQFGS